VGQALGRGISHDLPSLYTSHARCPTSPPTRPLGGTGRGRAPPSTPVLTGTGMPALSTKTEGIAVSKQAPSLRHAADEIGSSSGNDRYGEPPSKYAPTGWAYGPTDYRMGLTTTALTFKSNQVNEGHDPRARDRDLRLHG
jgi:hypothetical protein